MSNIETTEDIIDIAPDNVIDGKVEGPIAKKPALSWRRKLGMATAFVALGAVVGGWIYRDFLSSYLPSDQVQAMTARMDGIEATAITLNGKVEAVVGFTDEMKSKLAAAQVAVAEISKLETDSRVTKSAISDLKNLLAESSVKIEALKTQMAASNSTASSGYSYGMVPSFNGAALSVRVDALEKDLASLKQIRQLATNTTFLSQNLADLKAKIAAGATFQAEIDQIALLVPAADGLDVLLAHAAQGLPNAVGLSAELKTVLPSLPKPAPAPLPDNSWWGYSTSLLSSLVTIKTAGSVDWEQTALQTVALTEQGDVAAALANLKKVEGALPVELQRWYDRATARLDVERALEKTSAAALRQIAAKG